MATAAPKSSVPDRVVYLNVYVVLKDPNEVKYWQQWCKDHNLPGVTPPILGYIDSPNALATRHNAPWKGYTDPKVGGNYSWSPWKADDKGNAFPLDQAVFQIKSGGFWIFGGTVIEYRWLAQFVVGTDPDHPDGGTSTAYGPIRNRRWICGFELAAMRKGDLVRLSPDAARHVGGLGFAIRQNSGTVNITTTYYGGTAPQQSWERFYLRLRRKPTTTNPVFWQTRGTPSTTPRVQLGMTPAGDVVAYGYDGSTTVTLGTVVRMTEWDPVTNPHAWRKFDVFIRYDGAAPASNTNLLSIFVDGNPVFSVGPNVPGLATNAHTDSEFVSPSLGTDLLELDVDDWINADPGNGTPPVAYFGPTGKDGYAGSKIVRLHPKGFSTNHNAGAWPGDFRVLLQSMMTLGAPMYALSSSTSGALLAVDTDDAIQVDADTGKFGCAALLAAAGGVKTFAAANGQVGARAAGVTSMKTMTESNALTGNSALMNPPTVAVDPPDYTPIELRRTKGTDANASSTHCLSGEAELVGTWAKCDLYALTPEARAIYDAYVEPVWVGQHNWSYPLSPWAQGGEAPPLSPFIVKCGTYVGNNTGQDLEFRAPVNWLWIRRTGGGTVGVYTWWTGMLGAHKDHSTAVSSQVPLGIEDATYVGASGEGQQQSYLLRLAGNDPSNNAIGITYQYIAVCDPGSRYMLNMSCVHRNAEGTYDNKLVNADWLTEFAFLQMEEAGAGPARPLYARGPNSQSDAMSAFDVGNAITNSLSFAAGIVTSKAGVHAGSSYNNAFSLWRHSDGNGDPGQPGTVQIGGYTGDGSGSRTIGLTPSGLRPVFAIFFTEAVATGFWRDPSHTSTNSANYAGTDTANGITGGGIDSITVGSALNTNAIRYNYLVLMGSATAGNNGWGVNGEFINGEFYPPANGPWPPITGEPPGAPGTEPPSGGGGAGPPEPPGNNTGAGCVGSTQSLMNQALSRIGVSKQIGDLAAELTIEATSARLIVDDDVDATLRDFAWPFATKYAALALVSGSPAAPTNQDWIYTYQRPANCVYERRIVLDRGTAIDPTPPPFALGSDAAGGGLIYSNVANAVLEYTARVFCPASQGDALFREALMWRFAASLAPALSRMEGKTENALQMYERVLLKAQQILRPGNPGNPAAAGALDQSAAAQAANLAVVNLALVRIGAHTIRSLAEQNREATAARLVFEEELVATLRDFPWAFATAYVDPLTLLSGTPAAPVNPDWTYAYALPTDCVFARRLTSGARRTWEEQPPKFRIGQDGTTRAQVLFTDEQDAALEYTARLDGIVALGDQLFREALSWKLAATLAPSVAQVTPEYPPEQFGRGPDDAREQRTPKPTGVQLRRQLALDAAANYAATIAKAKAINAREQQPDLDEPDAPWILGRN
ncbi:MAG TPA: hypothetical protein VKB41_05060 [Steroidobacteraceae bacterium]|nr:hypothetical protein [Steroidobacteraceae bacterium]